MSDDARPRFDARSALAIALGVAGGFLLSALTQGVLVRLRDLIVTLVVSLFASFGMEPAVDWLDRRGIRRGFGTMLVFLLTAVILIGFFAAMVPLIIDQVTNLVEGGGDLLSGLANQARSLLPGDIGDSVARWIRDQESALPSRLPQLAPQLFGGALGIGATVFGSLLQLFTALLVTFYLVADGPRLRKVLSSRMEPERQREFLTWWELGIAKTGGYLYGRLLTAVASAAFHIVVFMLVGIPYATALGVWVGIVSSLIPVIGTYLAGALPLVVALSASVTDAVWVLAAVVGYQQVENYLVAPRITAHTLSLHPAVAFVSVLTGGALLGPIGALLAIPATAIVAALVNSYGQRHEVVEHGLLRVRAHGNGAAAIDDPTAEAHVAETFGDDPGPGV